MASSNRHWPSMFKSKPCNSHHQWHHDINPSLTSTGCHRSPYASVSGCEERSTEPKPRWNPKPEQIRILEAIFNSGMVNPPRDEIRKIRAQLQEYGQVGDANVFYWFQNRKSRSKHKLRHLQNSKSQSHQTHPVTSSAPSSSSSSSSDQKSSPNGSNKNFSIGSINAIEISNSPTASVNQTYFQPHNEFMPETFYFPLQHTTTDHYTQGFGFSELSNVVYVPDQQNVGPCTSLLLGELMNHGALKKEHDQNKLTMQQQLSYTVTSTPINTSANVTVPSTISDHLQGVGEYCGVGVGMGGATRSTVFINDMAFEVAGGPLNVREAFGDDAVLINSAGQPLLTNEWGVTLHSLQHGAFYYLI